MASQTKTQIKTKTKTITFVVNVPMYVEMTQQKFKEEYDGTDALWERLIQKAGKHEEIVEDADSGVSADEEAECEAGVKVFNLIEEIVDELKEAEKEEEEESEEEEFGTDEHGHWELCVGAERAPDCGRVKVYDGNVCDACFKFVR